jgi:hypothetical protein
VVRVYFAMYVGSRTVDDANRTLPRSTSMTSYGTTYTGKILIAANTKPGRST